MTDAVGYPPLLNSPQRRLELTFVPRVGHASPFLLLYTVDIGMGEAVNAVEKDDLFLMKDLLWFCCFSSRSSQVFVKTLIDGDAIPTIDSEVLGLIY